MDLKAFGNSIQALSGSGRSLPGKKDLSITRIIFSTAEEKELSPGFSLHSLEAIAEENTVL